MSATIDIAADAIMKALRAFLVAMLPVDTQVVAGQQNHVPLPQGRVVVITPLMQAAMDVPTTAYDRVNSGIGKRQSKDWRIQLDVYGDNAADAAAMLQTVFRTDYAFDWMADGYAIRPLYTEDPRNMAFINDAMNYESRWMLEVHLQANQTTTLPQDFAQSLHIGLVEVDTNLR